MPGKQTMWGLDLAGGLMAAAALATAVWLAVGPARSTSQRVQRLRSEAEVINNDIEQLRNAIRRQEDLTGDLQRQLQDKETSPTLLPLEQSLAAITGMANRQSLLLAEVSPIAGADYPGVHERRYRLKGQGRLPELLAFLAEFEACPIWADITALTLQRIGSSTPEGDLRPAVELTFSFYSVAEQKDGLAWTPPK